MTARIPGFQQASSSDRTCKCWADPNPPPGAQCKLCKRVVPGAYVHTCHARDCRVPVRPELLMCAQHWRQVPRDIQRAVYQHYRPGQCDDKRPSKEWHEAASAAIGYVAVLENVGIITVAEALALRAYGYATSADDEGELRVDPLGDLQAKLLAKPARAKKTARKRARS